MRAILRRFFFGFLALDVCAILLVSFVERTNPPLLISIRNAFFTKIVSDPEQLELPPAEQTKHGFLRDSPEEITKWRAILDNFVRYRTLFAQLDTTNSTLEKAKAIVLSFSRNGSPILPDGSPTSLYDKSADLMLKISTIIEPRGSCADHAEVFLALSNVAGLDAIKVECAHVTCAVYCPEWKKWIWIDPEFALLAKKPDGQYMSPRELVQANRNGETFDYDFFGTPEHVFSKMNPRDHEIYRPATFSPTLSVVWGNNVLTYDEYRKQCLFVPRSIRQAICRLTGIAPIYRLLDAGQLDVVTLRLVKAASWSVFILFLAGNLAFPVYLLLSRLAKLSHRSRSVGSLPSVFETAILTSDENPPVFNSGVLTAAVSTRHEGISEPACS